MRASYEIYAKDVGGGAMAASCHQGLSFLSYNNRAIDAVN